MVIALLWNLLIKGMAGNKTIPNEKSVVACFLLIPGTKCSSVQFSRPVMFDSLRPHGLQHARPPCLSPTSGVYSDSCPWSRWCHPTISSSVIPFSSCPQSFPVSPSAVKPNFRTSHCMGPGETNVVPGCLFLVWSLRRTKEWPKRFWLKQAPLHPGLFLDQTQAALSWPHSLSDWFGWPPSRCTSPG